MGLYVTWKVGAYFLTLNCSDGNKIWEIRSESPKALYTFGSSELFSSVSEALNTAYQEKVLECLVNQMFDIFKYTNTRIRLSSILEDTKCTGRMKETHKNQHIQELALSREVVSSALGKVFGYFLSNNLGTDGEGLKGSYWPAFKSRSV
jgi:hypothetical protein